MRILKCSCCGEDVTMPSFMDRKPYGYTCFARLFGGVKPVIYTAAEVSSVTRVWGDLKSNLSPEGWELKKDHFTIVYIHRFQTVKSPPMVAMSENAIQAADGSFWIPKDDLKKALCSSAKKQGLTNPIIKNELKAK